MCKFAQDAREQTTESVFRIYRCASIRIRASFTLQWNVDMHTFSNESICPPLQFSLKLEISMA